MSKPQFWVEDQTTQLAKQQVSFRFILKCCKSQIKAFHHPTSCMVVVSPLTIKCKSSVIFQRSFHSILPFAARDKGPTRKTYERVEPLVSISIISVYEDSGMHRSQFRIWTTISQMLQRIQRYVSFIREKSCFHFWPTWQRWAMPLSTGL